MTLHTSPETEERKETSNDLKRKALKLRGVKTKEIENATKLLNSLVAKGEVSLRMRNGYLIVTYQTTIGGDPSK